MVFTLVRQTFRRSVHHFPAIFQAASAGCSVGGEKTCGCTREHPRHHDRKKKIYVGNNHHHQLGSNAGCSFACGFLLWELKFHQEEQKTSRLETPVSDCRKESRAVMMDEWWLFEGRSMLLHYVLSTRLCALFLRGVSKNRRPLHKCSAGECVAACGLPNHARLQGLPRSDFLRKEKLATPPSAFLRMGIVVIGLRPGDALNARETRRRLIY